MMDVIASEAKQSIHFKHEIATATLGGLAMTIPQIICDGAVVYCLLLTIAVL
jgi:hypothetical protein